MVSKLNVLDKNILSKEEKLNNNFIEKINKFLLFMVYKQEKWLLHQCWNCFKNFLRLDHIFQVFCWTYLKITMKKYERALTFV